MHINPATLNRARGAFIGLACGDALGTTLEFKSPGSFDSIEDMLGAGPFGLKKGQWTDDTSMALCLAASLVAQGRCNPVDQLHRYVRWYDEGYMSCTGKCFDIGNTVSAALRRFETNWKGASGSTHASHSGNGALMRMAPVIIFNSADIDMARMDARTATVTTHASDFCTETSDLFAVMLWLAIDGYTKDQVLDSSVTSEWIDPTTLQPEVAAIVRGSYKHKHPPEIRGTGFVVQSLEAALWALYHHDDFETGALAAANLGEDADTTAAIYGQLAGAIYGYDAIPTKWREQIAWHQEIVELADALFLGVTRRTIEECLCYCQILGTSPDLGSLEAFLHAGDKPWLVNNYNSFTDDVPIDEPGVGGLLGLAARMTWYSRGDRFMDGFWDAGVADGAIPKFFNQTAKRLRNVLSLLAAGQP